MAKRRRAPRYTTKAGYQFTPKKEAELRTAVTNYNRRIARAVGIVSPELRGAFPSKISFAEIAEQITTTRDINKQIKRLSKYRAAEGGFNIVELGGRLFTQAEAAEIEAAARAETRRRRRLQRIQRQAEEREGRFRTSRQRELEPTTPDELAKRSPEKRQEIVRQLYQTEYVAEETIRWQKNYIQWLRKNIVIANNRGVLSEAASNAAEEIIQFVLNIDPNRFEEIMRTNLDLQILPDYDADRFEATIFYILNVWRSA